MVDSRADRESTVPKITCLYLPRFVLERCISSQLLEGGEKIDTLVSSAEIPKHKWSYLVKKMYCFAGMRFHVDNKYFWASPLPSGTFVEHIYFPQCIR